jgi:response regulator of citrate/malate metabolism
VEEERIPGKMLDRKIMLKIMNAIQENTPPYSLTRLAELVEIADSTLENYYRILKNEKLATIVLDFSRKLIRLRFVLGIVRGKWLDYSPLKEYCPY